MSVSDVHTALQGFWSKFGIPAYVNGHVPPDAAFPYITYEVINGDALTETVSSAVCWYEINRKTGDYATANAARATMLNSISVAIPAEGAVIPLAVGYLILRRNNANWQSYYDDPNDPYIIGGRISYIIEYKTL